MTMQKVKYLIVYDDLKELITKGKYSVGDLLPAEPFLQEKYNVSRVTIRHAIQLLEEDGYIKRIHGTGTIVLSQKKSLQLKNLISFSDENNEQNLKSSLLSFEQGVLANNFVCSKLDLQKGSKVSCHERLRCIGDSYISFQRVYLPSFIPLSEEEIAPTNASLYELFEEKGYTIKKATETIGSILTDKKLSEILQVPDYTPLLYVQRVTMDEQNRAIEYAEFFYRGDQYQYSVQLQTP
ncbi:GntR family transcriptional regulator [Mammaliicoccus lentus]|uniref:GntR family transcriptional regulator n=1 Tax=Mammaliicoccus lentus TaxID=42858 RepID=A0ABS6GTR9_MAMLE|nr:GntR family transcriptional regulator [Mammaliicoccus lentus]MBU6112815.1 GntR family transcriptional regulator [Mammaliicoccus lentus]